MECRFWRFCCTRVAACCEVLPGRQDLQKPLPGRQDLQKPLPGRQDLQKLRDCTHSSDQRADDLQFLVCWYNMANSHSVRSTQKEKPCWSYHLE